MNPDVLSAFDTLFEAILNEKARLADAVREATLEGQFAKAQRLLAKTERVECLLRQVQQSRETWERLDEQGTQLPIVGAGWTPEETGKTSGDDDAAPEVKIVEELFGIERRRERGRVKKTSKRAYWKPILEALEQLGGRGRMREVLSIVYEKMRDRLTKDDLKPTSGGRIRWGHTAEWARYDMVQERLLRNDSPRGVWEISEAGRAYLERAREPEAGEDEP